MRKLEPQMVNSDKVQNPSPLSPLGVINLSNNILRVTQCLSTLFIFQAELACRMKEWQVIPKVIEVSKYPMLYRCFSERDRLD